MFVLTLKRKVNTTAQTEHHSNQNKNFFYHSRIIRGRISHSPTVHQLMSDHVKKSEKRAEGGSFATWTFPPPTLGRPHGTKCTDGPQLHLTYSRVLISQRETDVLRCSELRRTMVIINQPQRSGRERDREPERERVRGGDCVHVSHKNRECLIGGGG